MTTLVTVSGTVLITSEDEDSGRHCPFSGTRGLSVKVDPTVGQHVREATWEHLVGVDSLWYCPAADCPIVYFDDARRHIWGIADLRTVVGAKTQLDPVPVCYCRRVTRGQITFELVEQGCCTSLQDIKEFTRANTGELCRITNPSGRCCGAHLKRVVAELVTASANRGALSNAVADEAVTCAACVPDSGGDGHDQADRTR